MNRIEELTNQFFEQIKYSTDLLENTDEINWPENIQSIVIAGLGGSGVGAGIVSGLLFDSLPVPVTIVKDYFLPGFVNKNTLVICSSYSGNTEETLSCYHQALEAQAPIIAITGGGQLKENAQRDGQLCFTVPAGIPPRTALGYTLPVYFFIFSNIFRRPEWYEKFKNSAQKVELCVNDIDRTSAEIAGFFYGKLPVFYSSSAREGLLIRLRQQINENAKSLCWHHIIPEMNHNELVGWRSQHEELAVLFIWNQFDHPKNVLRMKLTREVVSKYTSNILTYQAPCGDAWEEMLYLIHLFDKISCKLADMYGVDAEEIDVINYLKTSIGEKKK